MVQERNYRLDTYVRYECTYCGMNKGYERSALVKPCTTCGNMEVRIVLIKVQDGRVVDLENREVKLP